MAKSRTDEGPDFFRDSLVYREWGYKLTSLERYVIAEIYFLKAIQQGQNDLRTYLGLCKCQVKYARYIMGNKTTQKCMEIDPHYSKVKQMHLQTLFQIGEFEYSLIHAHQGFRKHETTTLEHGIHQGNETIEDCVGSNTHPKALELLLPWIHQLEEYRKLLIEKMKEEGDEFEGVEEEQARFKVNVPEARAEAAFWKLQKVVAKIYLGYLAHDKKFLYDVTENLARHKYPNKKTTERLNTLAETNFKRVSRREDILRMRRPLYVMLFERRAIPKGHRLMIEAETRLKRNIIIVEADFLLRRLHDFRMRKDYITFFRMVDRVKDKFDSYSTKMFPLKQTCLDAVYNMVAWAYIDPRDLTSLGRRRMKNTYLKHQLGIHVAKLPRDCDIAWVHAVDAQEAIRDFRRKLAMASEPLELAWLFHELSKHLIDIRRYDLARFYGKKACDMGEEAGSEEWMLNAHHLSLRIEISQNNRNEAKEAAFLALSISKKLGIDFLVDFYKRVLKMIDVMDVEKVLNSDAIAERQQLILDLMPDDMKPEVDFLWRSMEAVPAKRRLSVMPGCKPVDRQFKLPCKRMTIMPEPAKDPEREAIRALLAKYGTTLERPGFIDFHDYD